MPSLIPRRRKKSRKMRGSRLHGYGLQRQHRRSGRRGGFGNAGPHKHRWTWYTAYWPDYFGKGRRGFKRPRAVVREIRAINLSDIELNLDKFLERGSATRREDGVIEVDLSKEGYNKVLGKGRISTPMVIKAKYFSEKAIERIKAAGGEALQI